MISNWTPLPAGAGEGNVARGGVREQMDVAASGYSIEH